MTSQTPLYLLSWVAGVCGFWLLWSLGIKKLMLGVFRERLFEARFELFRLGLNGELDFDSELYRQLEILLCGLLRFSHRITFLSFVASARSQARARQSKEYVDVGQLIALKISRLDAETQLSLKSILEKVRDAIFAYIGFTSLLFLCIAIGWVIATKVFRWQPKSEKEITFVVEREAYRAEAMRPAQAAA
jgi:hypothetical protein